MKNISILGATGSIGTQTLDVIRNSEGKINLIGITANSSVDKIKEIIKEFKPKYVGMMELNSAKVIEEFCNESYPEIKVFSGIDGLIKIATLDEIDTVVTSVVGMIGLKPTMAAIEAKKDIALANKETLVVAGELVMNKAKENNVRILPVDSEHSAIFQSLSGYKNKDINKFLHLDKDEEVTMSINTEDSVVSDSGFFLPISFSENELESWHKETIIGGQEGKNDD